MPKRTSLIEGEHYFWDGTTKLVSLSEEASQAMLSAIEKASWPFIAELASWENNNPDSRIINFVRDEGILEAANDILQSFAAIVKED